MNPAATLPAEAQRPVAVVCLAASAGGVTALSTVLAALPADLPVPILAVEHLDPHHDTMLAEILSRRTKLRVKLAEDGELAEPGTVHLAPPDRHLLVKPDGTLALSEAAAVHFLRPAADLLFESAAEAYGRRAVAVVLTGTGTDGAEGVRAVRERGGTVVVQDLESSEFGGMPRAAADTGSASLVLPLQEIGPALRRLTSPGATR